MSGPAQCTDTLLVSASSRAEQERDTQAQGGRQSEGEILLPGRVRRVVHPGGRSVCVCVCVFGRLKECCVCIAGGTVCHSMSIPPAKRNRIINKIMQWQHTEIETPHTALVHVVMKN